MGLTPHRIPAILPKLFKGLAWRVKEDLSHQNIYLTFDDGPVPGPTEFVIDLLDQNKIKATFFCIGDNVRKHPEIFKKVNDAGHAIGNHTFNHLKGWSTSNKEYFANIQKCDDVIENLIGSKPGLFRPPYGRIRRNQIKALSNYKIVMWDVLSLDYQKDSNHEKLLKGTINSIRQGSIVVFHDSLKAEKNMRYILPRVIDHFGSLDFTFKPLK